MATLHNPDLARAGTARQTPGLLRETPPQDQNFSVFWILDALRGRAIGSMYAKHHRKTKSSAFSGFLTRYAVAQSEACTRNTTAKPKFQRFLDS
jgi:hypothetical protein